jgi:hypothetical protein
MHAVNAWALLFGFCFGYTFTTSYFVLDEAEYIIIAEEKHPSLFFQKVDDIDL